MLEIYQTFWQRIWQTILKKYAQYYFSQIGYYNVVIVADSLMCPLNQIFVMNLGFTHMWCRLQIEDIGSGKQRFWRQLQVDQCLWMGWFCHKKHHLSLLSSCIVILFLFDINDAWGELEHRALFFVGQFKNRLPVYTMNSDNWLASMAAVLWYSWVFHWLGNMIVTDMIVSSKNNLYWWFYCRHFV